MRSTRSRSRSGTSGTSGELAYWQWKAGELDDVPEWVAEPYRLQLDEDAQAAAEAWRRRLCPYEAARALADVGDGSAIEELEALGARPELDAFVGGWAYAGRARPRARIPRA